MTRLACLLSLLVPAWASAAPPSVPVLAPAEGVWVEPPSWCAGIEARDPASKPPRLSAYPGAILTLGALRELVLYSCDRPLEPERLAWVQAVRQSLGNDYGLTRADSDLVMRHAAKIHGGTTPFVPARVADDPVCQKLPPLADGPKAARLSRALERMAVFCGDWRDNRAGFVEPEAPYWHVDREGFGSELAEAWFVIEALPTVPGDLASYRRWVSASAVALDDTKFRRELAALALPERGVVQAILTFRYAYARAERDRRVVEQAVDAAPELAALFLSGPETARLRWAKEAAAHPAIFDEIVAIEAAPATKKDCGTRLFPAFETWLRATRKQHEDSFWAEIALRGPIGSNLTYGLALCGGAHHPAMGQVFAYYLARTTVERGPISASQAGMIEAYNATHPALLPAEAIAWPPSLSVRAYDPKATRAAFIASVKRSGPTTRITFRADVHDEPVVECKETEDLWAVTPKGQPVRALSCTETETKELEDTEEPAPIVIPSFAAGGLAKGQLLRFWEAKGGAWPIESYDGEKLINLLGAKF